MGRTLDRGILVGIGLLVALLVVSAGLAYRNTQQLNEDAGWVAHTHAVLDLTSDVLRTLVDAETGERGFLVTGKDEFLQPYQAALAGLGERMAKLKDMTTDNPQQQDRIQKLEGLIGVRLVLLKEGIDLRRQSEEAARAFTASGKDNEQMGAIRDLLANMKQEENDLLRNRESRSRHAYGVAVTTGLITAVAGLASVGAFVWLLHRSLAARQKAAAAVNEQREWLKVTLSSIGDAVIATDLNGRVVLLNPVAESLTGWARQEAEGKPFDRVFKIVNEHTRQPVENLAARAVKEGTVLTLAEPAVLIARDGTERHIDDSAAPIKDEKHHIAGVVLIFRDVTERYRADEARRHLAAIVDSSDDAIIGKALDGTITSWNAGAERVYGYNAEEIVGKSISALMPPDDVDELPGLMDRLRRGEAINHYETVRCRKDGKRIDVSVSYSPIRDGSGRVVGASVIARDISEHKRAAEALRGSEQRFGLFMQHLLGLAWIKDAQGRYVYVNDAAEKAFGTPRADLYGRTDEEIFPPETVAQFKENDRRARASATGVQVVETLKHEDGVLHYSIVSKFPIPGPDGKAALIGGMAIDITDLKRAEEAHRESEERFRTLADSIPQLAWMARPDGHIFWYNRRWYDYTGMTPEQMEGWGWEKVHDPGELPRVLKSWRAALDSGQSWEDTFPLRRRDGAMRWHLSRALPVRDEQGHVTRWFGTNTDITERMEMEAALKEADRRKDEFLAMLAHELRNPLAPIRNALHVLRLPGADAAITGRAREVMERQVEHMVRIVDDLLDVSRIMRGKIELRKGIVELATVVARAVETSQPMIDAGGHQLTVSLPPEPLWLHGDLVRLAQVISNLLNNSAKYTENGGKIWLTGERAGGEAVVRVRDTGIGIALELLPRIFDLFVQADRALDRSQGGMGIGLTLVRSLVEMHGGSVEAHSAGPGIGSTFTVKLPLIEPSAEVGASGRRAEPSGAEQRSRRVLLVDDNVDAAHSLALLFRLQGHDVRVAHDGPSALAQATADPPDVALLDIGMPNMDGLELARRFKQSPVLRKVRLVALTGWGQEEDRRRTKEAGFDHHLVKPVEPEVLDRLLTERL